jgi:hypothetical protein
MICFIAPDKITNSIQNVASFLITDTFLDMYERATERHTLLRPSRCPVDGINIQFPLRGKRTPGKNAVIPSILFL